MKLFLLRHAIAVERGTAGFEDDSLRPLTEAGRDKMQRIARGMKMLGLSFDHILTSPYVRAEQTARIVAAALELEKRLVTEPLLAAEQEPRAVLAKLAGREWESSDVLLVGHEPYLSELASLMIGSVHCSALKMKKGGLCKLDALQLNPCPDARLDWLLTPKQLRAMGV
jgi:phosphohistidine phosphatase